MKSRICKLLILLILALKINAQSIESDYSICPTLISKYLKNYDNEISKVEGIVSGLSQSAVGGWQYGEMHMFKLEEWKCDNSYQMEPLLVFRPIYTKSRDTFSIPAYSVVGLELYMNCERNRAIFISGEYINNPDIDLIEKKEQLVKPIFLKNEEFGDFKLNKSLNYFENTLIWQGESVDCMINAEDKRDKSDEIKILQTLKENESKWQRDIEETIIRDLLPLKNRSWLDKDEKEWSERELINAINLKSIYIFEDGILLFEFDDGEVFLGHNIIVNCSIKKGPYSAEI